MGGRPLATGSWWCAPSRGVLCPYGHRAGLSRSMMSKFISGSPLGRAGRERNLQASADRFHSTFHEEQMCKLRWSRMPSGSRRWHCCANRCRLPRRRRTRALVRLPHHPARPTRRTQKRPSSRSRSPRLGPTVEHQTQAIRVDQDRRRDPRIPRPISTTDIRRRTLAGTRECCAVREAGDEAVDYVATLVKGQGRRPVHARFVSYCERVQPAGRRVQDAADRSRTVTGGSRLNCRLVGDHPIRPAPRTVQTGDAPPRGPNTWPKAVQSLTFLAVSTIGNGRPGRSTVRWILVITPRRDRPPASARQRMVPGSSCPGSLSLAPVTGCPAVVKARLRRKPHRSRSVVYGVRSASIEGLRGLRDQSVSAAVRAVVLVR